MDYRAARVPDIPVEPAGDRRYHSGMEARIAELEQLARLTATLLERIERRLDPGLTHADDRMDRIERRLDMPWHDQRSNFRWLFGVMFAGTGAVLTFILCLIGVMAHGFHWL